MHNSEDAHLVNLKLKIALTEQIRNCKMDDLNEINKAYKAFAILTDKLSEEATSGYLSSIEYFGSLKVATAAVMADYYSDSEVRISNPLRASTSLIDDFAEHKSFGGDEKYLANIFSRASDDLKIACSNFLFHYAYEKTKSLSAVTFLMTKLNPIKE